MGWDTQHQSACTAVPHRMGYSFVFLLSLKGSSTLFLAPLQCQSWLFAPNPGLEPTIQIGVQRLPLTAHRHTCVSKGLAREQQWLSGPCILKCGTRIILNPAVFWGKTILPGHAPAHLSAWDTSAQRHTPVVSRFPPMPHTTLSLLQTTHGANALCASSCPRAFPPYLAPVLVQSAFQLQGQLQEPVLHLDKAGVTDRLNLCSQQYHSTRAMLCTLGNAGGGSEWNGQTIVGPHSCSSPGEISPAEDSTRTL